MVGAAAILDPIVAPSATGGSISERNQKQVQPANLPRRTNPN
jgi:hypothetical protein